MIEEDGEWVDEGDKDREREKDRFTGKIEGGSYYKSCIWLPLVQTNTERMRSINDR